MLNAQELRSEVTRLLAKIREQYEAIQQSFPCSGDYACNHLFLIGRMENMQELRRQLRELVGDAASAMIAKELEARRHQMVSNQSQTPAISSLVPLDLLNMTYSSDLLLDSHLDVSIIGDADFPDACEWGFTAFLNEVESGDYGSFTESEVRARVRREMLEVLSSVDQVSLAWYVGFVLGWLSTLAFVQRDEALAGLNELLSLVNQS